MIKGSGPYYYLVESYRNDEGKPRQRHIAYVGKDKGKAEEAKDHYNSHGEVPKWVEEIGKPGDEETRRTPKENKELEEERKKVARKVEETEDGVNEALERNKVERTIIDTRDPSKKDESKARREKERRTSQAKKEIEDELDEAHKSVEEFRGVEVEVSKKSKSKWSRQRKKEARIIADNIGCGFIQADALNQRAKRAGFQYDEVDWDRIQGSDLTYSERVDKLNEALGVRTMTRKFTMRVDKDMDEMLDKWEDDPYAYQDEVEGMARDMFYSIRGEIYT